MSRQYKRVCSISIISRGKTKTIEGLRIAFEITKSIKSYPNLATIQIYNPNSETSAMLNIKYAEIILNAGYQGRVRLLFKGQVRNTLESSDGIDNILTVYAGDGEVDWQNSIFNKTISENITISQLVRDLANTLNNTMIGALEGLERPADKVYGQTLSGNSKDILDTLAKDYGFDWSIQDGMLITVPQDQVISDREAVLVTGATGMIGSPTITEIGANVTTLLNPDLMPTRAFKIESLGSQTSIGNLQFRELRKTRAEGSYKTIQVTFSGDTHSDNWYSMVEGITLNA